MSGHIRHLSILHSHVFLINSRQGHFSATTLLWCLLFRSYETNLPSSLAVIHSSALVYSTWPPVSVSGTDRLSRFSWKKFYGFALAEASAQRTLPSVRNHHVSPSLLMISRYRNINLFSIGFPYRVHLRIRLNLIWLTLIRNPWSFGEEVFHFLNRYLCLHFLFYTLQRTLRFAFTASRMLPYHKSTASVLCLCPIIIHAWSLD